MKIVQLLLIMLFVFGGNKSLFSQESIGNKTSYKIVTKNSEKEEKYYLNALEKANMETFRLKNKEVTLKFKDGAKCILLPATAVKAMGVDIDLNDYKESFPDGYKLPLFSINADGHLLASYEKKLK